MRGFDKLEEGRSRVLVYQVGSIQIIYQDIIRWLYQVDCQMDPYQILVDVSRVYWIQLDPVGSMCILGGSMYILVDLSWIQLDPCISQLDPCISQQSLYRPQYIHYQILVDPCRSLVYPLVSLYTHSIPINPLLSTLIHPIHLFYIF